MHEGREEGVKSLKATLTMIPTGIFSHNACLRLIRFDGSKDEDELEEPPALSLRGSLRRSRMLLIGFDHLKRSSEDRAGFDAVDGRRRDSLELVSVE